jgi:hypothetical protein
MKTTHFNGSEADTQIDQNQLGGCGAADFGGCGDTKTLYHSSDGASGNTAPVFGIEDTTTICKKIIFDADVV